MRDDHFWTSDLDKKLDLIRAEVQRLSKLVAEKGPQPTDFGTRIRQVTTALFYAGIGILLTQIMFVISAPASMGSKAIEVGFEVAMGAFMFRFWIYHTMYLERYPSDFTSLVFQFMVAISFILLLALIATHFATVFLFFAVIVSAVDAQWCSYELKRLGNGDEGRKNERGDSANMVKCDDLREWYKKHFDRWLWGAKSKLLVSGVLLWIVGILEGLEKAVWKEPALLHIFNYSPDQNNSMIRELLIPSARTENILYVVVGVFIAVRIPYIINRCRIDLEEKRQILNRCSAK